MSLVRGCLFESLSYSAPRKPSLRTPTFLKAMSRPAHKEQQAPTASGVRMPQRRGTSNTLVIVRTPTAGRDTGSRREARRPAPPCTHHEHLNRTWFPSINQESSTGYPRHLSNPSPCVTVQLESAGSDATGQRQLMAPGAGCPAAGGWWSTTWLGQPCTASLRPSEAEDVVLIEATAVRLVPVGGR